MTCPKELQVNVRLVPVKATYFFTLAAVASLLPYLPVYMRQAGLSPMECGIIYGTMPFIGAFIRPIFGAVADKLHKHKAVLMLSIFMSGVFHAMLLAVPHQPVSTRPYNRSQISINMSCTPNSARLTFCPHNELLNMGCKQTKSSISNPSGEIVIGGPSGVTRENRSYVVTETPVLDPLAHLRNCTMLCRFDDLNDLNELCIRYYGSKPNATDVCPINKGDSKKKIGQEFFSELPDNIQHRINKATFQMSLFMEKLLFKGHHYSVKNRNYSEAYDVCYNYVAKNFQYKEKEYDHNWVFECDKDASLVCKMECHTPPVNLTSIDGYDCTDHHVKYGKSFWLFFFIFMIAQIWFAPVFTLIDGIVYDYLGEERGKWGVSRLFGTLGFIIFGVTSGFSMDLYEGDDGLKNYTPAFIMFLVLSIIATIIVCFYNVSTELCCNQIFSNTLNLFRELRICVFMFIILVFGIDTGVIETFLFLHLQENGASQLLLGLCMMMNCILEVFILFAAGKIIKTIGHITCFYIVFVAYFLRLIMYSFVSNPWIVLAVEPLHSITFGLCYASATSYGSVVTPAGMHGTIQGLIGAFYFGIGKGIGGVSGSKIYDIYGPHLMFRAYAIATAVVFVIYALIQFLLFKHVPTYQPSPTHEITDVNGSKKKPLGSSGDTPMNGYNTNLEPDDSITFSKDREMLVFKDGAFEEDGDLGMA